MDTGQIVTLLAGIVAVVAVVRIVNDILDDRAERRRWTIPHWDGIPQAHPVTARAFREREQRRQRSLERMILRLQLRLMMDPPTFPLYITGPWDL